VSSVCFTYAYLKQLERQLAIKQDFLYRFVFNAASLAPAVGSVCFTYAYLRQLERQLAIK
jgi:hypothetical protein